MSEPTDGRTRQVRIADHIRDQIESGRLASGDKLPGLPTLAAEHAVSIVTVRQAIGLLRQQGLVISHQGKGNFVRDRSRHRRYGIDRYSRSVWAGTEPQPLLVAEGDRQGHAVGQRTATETVPAPDFAAERLAGVQTGDTVHVRRRVTTLDGQINQSADSYFAQATAERNPALLTGEGSGGHIARINAVSEVTDIQEELAARMPTTAEAARLDIPEGTPVVEVIRSYHTADGVLDVTRFIIRADMASFDYRFAVPE